MGVKAYLNRKGLLERFDAGIGIAWQHGPGGVHDIDAIGTVGFHELRLLHKYLWRTHMRHHEETDRLHAKLPGDLEVFLGDIGLGALRGDAYHLCSTLHRLLEFSDGSNARQEEHGDFCSLADVTGFSDELHLLCRREPVQARGTSQAIPS